MMNNESEPNNVSNNSNGLKICDLDYLSETMGGKKNLVKEIIEVFLEQIVEELHTINDAVINTDYAIVKNIAHTMKSTVSIMGITILTPLLNEMEGLGGKAEGIEKLMDLNENLNLICNQAILEIENEKHNYV